MTTTPTQVVPTRTIELPEVGFPMVTRMVSDNLFPETSQQNVRTENPVMWVVSQQHPLVPEMKVTRMYSDQWGVEVYSVSTDGRNGMRNFIPRERVRIVEEVMPIEIFVEEIEAAEADDDEPDEPEPPAATVAPAPNGQAVS